MSLRFQNVLWGAMLPVLLVAAGGSGTSSTRGIANMIEYQVSPTRSDYVSGEEVEITIRIVNRGTVPVEVPDPSMRDNLQPAYRLTGPLWPDGISLTSAQVLPEGVLPVATDQKLVSIQPGATWARKLSLSPVVDLTTPGEYTLTSKLEWEDIQAQSEQSTFRVTPMQVTSIHLGLGTRPMESAEGEGAFIQHGDSASQIYAFTFREMRPSIGEAEVQTPIHRMAAGANASDIAVPWRKAPFFNELIRWLVWREGQSVKALANVSRQPVSFDLPTDLGRLVLPPLKATGGPVEVMSVSKDGSKLYLTEFAAEPAKPGVAKLAWTAGLPAHPMGITAALSADSESSPRHIAFVAEDGEGFEIFHGEYKPGGPAPVFRSVRIPSGRPIPGAEPALFVEPDGRARVGVLAYAEGEQPVATLVEAVFTHDGAADYFPIRLGELPAKPTGGALLYVDKPGAPPQRAGVISVNGDHLFKLDQNLKLVPVTPGIPTHPLLLAPGKQTNYILCIDPARGLYIEAL
jgi:hypothetical protein